jgi:general secretion pathway protein L
MATAPGALGTRMQPLRLKTQRFWRWWSGELLALVPQRFTALAGAGRVPTLGFEGNAVVLVDPPAGDGQPASVEVSALESAQAAAAVRALLERAGETRGRARVALSPGQALVRRVTMPAATEENLASVLGFEMDRLTPFRAEEVYYDHRVLSRDAAAGTLNVLLAVARRDVIEDRLARARALGLSVQGVAVAEEAPRSGPPLDLLPREERGEREGPRERLAKQVLAASAALLLLAALFLPAWLKNREVHAIKPALDKAHAEARATDALVGELDRLVADHNFLLAKRHAVYPTLAYLEEVTRLLPDNTWLQQLEIRQSGKARELVMAGETISSSRLIEILEQSKLLQNATPRGTVTRGTQPGTERFVIASELRTRQPPEAVAVTQPQTALALAPAYAPPQSAPPPAVAATPAGPPSGPAAPPPPVAATPAGPPPATDNRPGARPYVPQVPPELLKPQPGKK